MTTAPGAESLQVGFTECYRARLPLDDFIQLYPDVAVQEQAFPRNPFDAAEHQPLPMALDKLPDVFPIILGHFSDDLRDLADRGLIEPLDSLLPALGIDPSDFLPQVIEAVRYRGKIWAVPHHLQVDALHFHREEFSALGVDPVFGSWEELLEFVTAHGPPENMLPFSANRSLFECAALIAQTTGGAPVDYADPVAWKSERMEGALQLLSNARDRRLLETRNENEPPRKNGTALLGIGRVESLYNSAPYGIAPYPARLWRDDPPAENRAFPGLLEAYVLRRGNDARETALDFLRWLLDENTEWEVFAQTNTRDYDRAFVMDSVHVPLRPAIWQSVDFEYASKKFPEFDILREIVTSAHISRWPAALDKNASKLATDFVTRELGGAPPGDWLEKLHESASLLIRNTSVESHAYDAY